MACKVSAAKPTVWITRRLDTMLTAQLDGNRIEATAAVRGQPFSCPECNTTVILKHGPIVRAHFAHKPPTDCRFAVGETIAHLAAKQWMLDGLRAHGYQAALEVNCCGDNRADVLVTGQNHKLAIELQHTNISTEDLEDRVASYAHNGFA